MLQFTIRTLFLFTIFIIIGNLIGLATMELNNLPIIMQNLILISMLGVLFVNVVKLVKSMEG